jgi:hypothetical protein
MILVIDKTDNEKYDIGQFPIPTKIRPSKISFRILPENQSREHLKFSRKPRNTGNHIKKSKILTENLNQKFHGRNQLTISQQLLQHKATVRVAPDHGPPKSREKD